jgi:hypothetical protein
MTLTIQRMIANELFFYLDGVDTSSWWMDDGEEWLKLAAHIIKAHRAAIGVAAYREMTEEQQRLLAAGQAMAAKFPPGLSKQELVAWVKWNLLADRSGR